MPSKRTNAYQGQPRYTQVALHTSAQDLPIPILWGTRRLTPNCIWQLPSGPFNSPASWTDANGNMDVYGDQEGNNTVIICPGIFGLCEGPIDNPQSLLPGFSAGIVQQSWLGTFQTSPLANQKVGWVYGYGTIGQPLWAYFTQPGIPYPDVNASPLAGVPGPGATLPYSGLAYVASYAAPCAAVTQPSQQNAAAQFTQLSIQIVRTMGTSLIFGFDVSPAMIIPDFLTNPQYGAGMQSSDIDSITLTTAANSYTNYCMAQGIFFSPLLDSQTKATDIIDRWAQQSNAWIFYDGTKFVFVPLGDVLLSQTYGSTTYTYTPDLTPAYNLGLSDFITDGRGPPVTVTRADPADCPNRLLVEYTCRSQNYATSVVEYKDQALIDQFGLRDSGSPFQADDCCTPGIATAIAFLMGKRLSYIRNTYNFTLSYRYLRLLPGTVVTLTEPNLGLVQQAVRIREIEEDDRGRLRVLAEELPGTTGINGTTSGQTSSGNTTNSSTPPPNINTPCIVEPSSALSGPSPELLIAASGPPQTTSASWGGCIVSVSFDMINWTPIGRITQPAYQGLLTANLPATPDPDTTDTLSVNFSESRLLATNATHADADAARTLSVIETQPTAGSGVTGVMPAIWEFLSYGSVAAGSGSVQNLTYLRRGQYGTADSTHATGDQFTRVDATGANGTTILWPLQAQYVGKTIYFAFQSFNTWGDALQPLSTAPIYQYTTTGAGFGPGTGGIPSTPTGLAATGGYNQITLSWTPNPSSDNITSYTLYRAPGLGASFGSAAAIITVNALGYVDTGLPASTSYTYFLIANNAIGSSGHTAGVGATTLAGGVGGVLTGVDVVTDPAHPDNAHAYVVSISGPAGGGGTIPAHFNQLQHDAAQGTPTWSHATPASDVATSNMVQAPQRAFATASGAHRQPGSSIVSVGQPTNGGTVRAFWELEEDSFGGVARLGTTLDFAGSTLGSALWLGSAAGAPTHQNFSLFQYASGDLLVLGGANLFLQTPGNQAVVISTAANSGTGVSGSAISIQSGPSNGTVMCAGQVSNQRYSSLNQLGIGSILTATQLPGTFDGVTFIANATTAYSGSNPVGGAILEAIAGALWVFQSNGTNFQIAPGAVTSVTGSGAGISVSPTTGAVVISNTGVTSVTAGAGISVSASTGAVTITNTSAVTWADDLTGSTNSGQWVSAISGSGGGGGTIPLHVNTLQFDAGQATPTLSQAPAASDVATQNLLIGPQPAYASATGTHRQSGSVEVFLSAPTNGGTAEAALQIVRQSAGTVLFLQSMPGVSTTGAIYSGVGTPSATNYMIAQDSGGGAHQINDGGSGNINFNFSGTQAVGLTSSLFQFGSAIAGLGAPLPLSVSSAVTQTSGSIDLGAGGYTNSFVVRVSATLTANLNLRFPTIGSPTTTMSAWLLDLRGLVQGSFDLTVDTSVMGTPLTLIVGSSGGTNAQMYWIARDTQNDLHFVPFNP